MWCDVMRLLQLVPLQGHGQALLAFIYSLARSRQSVFEVTVEDPAPDFEKVWQLLLYPGSCDRVGRNFVVVDTWC